MLPRAPRPPPAPRFAPCCISQPSFRLSRRAYSSTPEARGPLAGVRVLDLSRVLAGPYCTMVLGDLGAEVIKVEKPGTGDDTRSWGPPFVGTESAYFISVNRNKKSITINTHKPEGIKLLHELAAKSDVFVENFIPGKAKELGFDYDTLAKINSRLIYASITGFGPDGPYAQRPGYDVIVAAIGGLMDITGEEGGAPVKTGVALTDVSTGLFAQGAITAALFARERTGRGQKIDLSLLESQVANLVNAASAYLIGGVETKRRGTAHESIVPYQAFPTADGYIIVGAGNNKQFERLCKAIGQPEVAIDSRFDCNSSRVANRGSLVALLESVFKQRSTDYWVGVMRRYGIPYGPINNMKKVFEDPQVLHRGMVQEMEHPVGKIRVTGIPVKYSDTKPSIRLPPPLLGQHTDEVLQQLLSYSPEKIKALRDDEVI